jgi:hypothetical protein
MNNSYSRTTSAQTYLDYIVAVFLAAAERQLLAERRPTRPNA